MKNWDIEIANVVNSLKVPFDSHLVIRELAHRNQRRYVSALSEMDSNIPFQQLHSLLGKRIKVVCEDLGFNGVDSRSPDMFGQNSQCQEWS